LQRLEELFEESERPERSELLAALAELEADCQERGYELKQTASGYRFQVRAELARWVGRLWEEKPKKYSRALLETLALIAYRQPITRGDIEQIRGVAVSSDLVRTLMEREWVRVVGHRDVPGRPALYATTRQFLDYFNLASLDQLPPLGEIRDLDEFNVTLDLGDSLGREAAVGGGDADGDGEDRVGPPGDDGAPGAGMPADTTNIVPLPIHRRPESEHE
jgi:segregation and condensation protein B